jgi:hypothetical protein
VRVAVSFVVLFTYVVVARVAMVVAGVQGLFVSMWRWIGRQFVAQGRTIIAPFVALVHWVRTHIPLLRSIVQGFYAHFVLMGRWAWNHIGPHAQRVLLFVRDRLREYMGSIRAGILLLVDMIKNSFTSIPDFMLGPLRRVAREIVSAYQDLPAALRPAGMNGMVGTLERFASGGGSAEAALVATRTATTNATVGAPAVAAATTQASALQGAASRASGAAPVVVQAPAPAPVTTVTQLVLDGRQIAESVQRHTQDDQIRRGVSVPTRRGPME